ncbi:MAG: polysaccharide biosynthesis protein [Candidatus Thorarchaeota archaeon]
MLIIKGDESTLDFDDTAEQVRDTLNVGLVGAGAAGKLFLEVIKNDYDKLRYVPVVLLDDNEEIIGSTIDKIPVEGPISNLPEIVKKYSIDLILITMPSVPGETIRKILDYCEQASVRYRVVPPAYTNLQISGIKSPRRVSIEDLLNIRPKTILDASNLTRVKSETILVTGAAGSIGSELTRQLAMISPKSIIALDMSESGLYDLQSDIKNLNTEVDFTVVLCDIRDKKKLTRVLQKYKPSLIFHSAAYKHVPMLELYPEEAIETNIGGTLNLLESTIETGPSRLVMISTDKAVEPCNIMGMTKKAVELLAACHTSDDLEILVVRFGNVIESNGSVIPLFRKQIKDGGPVTVTDPEVERYFMTTSEAAQLVIQTSLLGKKGHTYVLHMGEQRKILDLARDLIRLSGLQEGRDIDIIFTGLRPGEKLSEKLFSDGEKHRLINDSLIYEVEGNDTIHCADIMEMTRDLLALLDTADIDKMRVKLTDLVNST